MKRNPPPPRPIPRNAACQTAAAAAEHLGIIWMALEEPIIPLPEVPEHTDPSFVRCPLPALDCKASAAQMADNFLDQGHFAFLHVNTFADPDEVRRAMVEPPSTTRAYFRGRCLAKWPDSVVAANWDSVVLDTGSEPLRRIPMMEPTRGSKEHVAALLAIDARLATSFTTGLLAAVNPCGFVLLPTYLVYFLGMENLRPGAERSSIGRALAVSLSVSAGFIYFLVAHAGSVAIMAALRPSTFTACSSSSIASWGVLAGMQAAGVMRWAWVGEVAESFMATNRGALRAPAGIVTDYAQPGV